MNQSDEIEIDELVHLILNEPESEVSSKEEIIKACLESYYGPDAKEQKEMHILNHLRMWVSYFEENDYSNISFYKLLTLDEAYGEASASSYNFLYAELKNIAGVIRENKQVTIEEEHNQKVVLKTLEDFVAWRKSRFPQALN